MELNRYLTHGAIFSISTRLWCYMQSMLQNKPLEKKKQETFEVDEI